jgi:hypothetical protein
MRPSQPFNAGGHPTDGDLLRYADGELAPAESRVVRGHLDSCWQCRSELAEIERTIARCVKYRGDELPGRLPEPPSPWMDIRVPMADLDQALNGMPWYARMWEAATAGLARQRAWASAVALLLIGALVVHQLRYAPSVRAAELLEKAARARDLAAEPRSVPRRIEVRTGSRRAIRTAGTPSAGDATLAAVEPLFARANYDWADPLSAASFARWRDALPSKTDEVTAVRDAAAPGRTWYRVRTTTGASFLESAMLQLTAEDLRPVEAAFEFESRERVEISDLGPATGRDTLSRETPAVVTPPPVSPGAVPAVVPSPAPEPPAASAPVIERPATAGEELEVLAALHRLGADLGEPVEVTRQGAHVVVKGLGVSPVLGRRIAAELSSMPKALLRLEEPASMAAPASTFVRPAAGESGARWPGAIEAELGGRAEYDQFVDEVVSAGDQLMTRMHALRRLAERFGPDTVAGLSAKERALLETLVKEHSHAAVAQVRLLDDRSRRVMTALGARPAPVPITPGATWQASVNAMFAEARRAESLVAAILGGVAGGVNVPADEMPARLLAATTVLRQRAAELTRQNLP